MTAYLEVIGQTQVFSLPTARLEALDLDKRQTSLNSVFFKSFTGSAVKLANLSAAQPKRELKRSVIVLPPFQAAMPTFLQAATPDREAAPSVRPSAESLRGQSCYGPPKGP